MCMVHILFFESLWSAWGSDEYGSECQMVQEGAGFGQGVAQAEKQRQGDLSDIPMTTARFDVHVDVVALWFGSGCTVGTAARASGVRIRLALLSSCYCGTPIRPSTSTCLADIVASTRPQIVLPLDVRVVAGLISPYLTPSHRVFHLHGICPLSPSLTNGSANSRRRRAPREYSLS